MFITALILNIVLPFAILYVLLQRERYHTVKRPVLLIALGWGIISFGISRGLEQFLIHTVGLDFFGTTIFAAPVIEELSRGIAIVVMYVFVLVRYSGDGLLYGFAIGLTFGISENIAYLAFTPRDLIASELIRVVSTGMMHACTAGLVGAFIAVAVYYPLRRVALVSLGLLAIAVGLHAAYNLMLWYEDHSLIAITGAAAGVGLLVLTVVVQSVNDRFESNRVYRELHGALTGTEMLVVGNSVKLMDKLIASAGVLGEQQSQLMLEYLNNEGRRAILEGKLTLDAERPVAIKVLQREIDLLSKARDELSAQFAPETREWLDAAKAELGE